MLDTIFGASNFKNEIIWHYEQRNMHKISQFNRKHDNIFWYCKNANEKTKFNMLSEKYTEEEVRSWRKTEFDEKAR